MPELSGPEKTVRAWWGQEGVRRNSNTDALRSSYTRSDTRLQRARWTISTTDRVAVGAGPPFGPGPRAALGVAALGETEEGMTTQGGGVGTEVSSDPECC